MLNTNHQFSIENHSFSDHTPKQPLEQLQHRAELTVTQAPGYITVVVTRVLLPKRSTLLPLGPYATLQ